MSIEGIPEGWELVRVGEVQQGEFFILSDGLIEQHDEDKAVRMNKNYVIIRKIEKPRRYRPFANAAEYMPNWGKPVCYKNKASSFSLSSVVFAGNLSVYLAFGDTTRKLKYQEAFDMLVFEDGTPFGVEVTE